VSRTPAHKDFHCYRGSREIFYFFAIILERKNSNNRTQVIRFKLYHRSKYFVKEAPLEIGAKFILKSSMPVQKGKKFATGSPKIIRRTPKTILGSQKSVRRAPKLIRDCPKTVRASPKTVRGSPKTVRGHRLICGLPILLIYTTKQHFRERRIILCKQIITSLNNLISLMVKIHC
jgi:hypothetical protein